MGCKIIVFTSILSLTLVHCKRVVDFVVCAYIHPRKGYQKIYCLEDFKNYCCYEHNRNHSDDDNHAEEGVHCCDFDELKSENVFLFASNTIVFVFIIFLFLTLIILLIAWIVLCMITRSSQSSDKQVSEQIEENDEQEKAYKEKKPIDNEKTVTDASKDISIKGNEQNTKDSEDIEVKGSPIDDNSSVRSKSLSTPKETNEDMRSVFVKEV